MNIYEIATERAINILNVKNVFNYSLLLARDYNVHSLKGFYKHGNQIEAFSYLIRNTDDWNNTTFDLNRLEDSGAIIGYIYVKEF